MVTTEPNPVTPQDVPGCFVIKTSAEINLAKWYNLGFEAAKSIPGTTEILWMESDARLSPDAVYRLQDVLLDWDLSLVGPDFYGREAPPEAYGDTVLKFDNSRIPHTDRVCQVSMAQASSPLRMDERFRWWFEADDLEYRARLDKGTGLVYETGATHSGQLSWDMPAELKAKALEGEKLFREIWGKTPFED